MVDSLRHHGLKVEVSEEKMMFNMSKYLWTLIVALEVSSSLLKDKGRQWRNDGRGRGMFVLSTTSVSPSC